MELFIKVIPKASRSEIVGWENHELKVRLKAIPAKGEANTELIQFLAKAFDISKSQIEIVSGKTSRHKRVKITGMTQEQLDERISIGIKT